MKLTSYSLSSIAHLVKHPNMSSLCNILFIGWLVKTLIDGVVEKVDSKLVQGMDDGIGNFLDGRVAYFSSLQTLGVIIYR